MGVRRRGARKGAKAAAGEAAGEGTPPSDTAAEPKQLQPQQQQQQPRVRASSGLKPELEEVLAAIESLYEDELKPFGRILRKRLAERVAPEAALKKEREDGMKAKGSNLPDIDVKHLLALCEASASLRVDPEEGGDWSAILVDRPEAFVDIYNLDDTYPETFWSESHDFFGKLEKGELLLPGGRYSCAQMLVARDLPFLEGFSLGQVCHFVQLAISKHKVLGYSDGSVVPYAYSQSMVKEKCAKSGAPCAGTTCADGTGAPGMPFATWDVARECLKEILEASVPPDEDGPGWIPLSNVKRLFRSKYQVELSETALGHSKLSELLAEARFQDVCSVKLDGTGYVVVQVIQPAAVAPAPAPAAPASEPRTSPTAISLADSLLQDSPPSLGSGTNYAEAAGRLRFCLDEPLGFEDAGFLTEDGWSVPAMALAGAAAAATPMPSPGVPPSCTVRRWGEQQLPPHQERDVAFLDACGAPLQLDGLELCGLGGCTEFPGFDWMAGGTLPSVQQTPLPSPGVFDLGLPPLLLGTRQDEGAPAALLAASLEPQRVREFCPDAPLLGLEELVFGGSSTPLPSPGVPPSTTVKRWRGEGVLPAIPQGSATSGQEEASACASVGSSPSRSAAQAVQAAPPAQSPSVKWQVQNTFIHAAPLPPTPLPGARRRAQSVPREVGATSPVEVLDRQPPPGIARPMLNQASGCNSRDSTADSSTGGSAGGLAPPLSPASSSGSLGAGAPPETPVKVKLNRLESMGGVSEEALRTPKQGLQLLLLGGGAGGDDGPLTLEGFDDICFDSSPCPRRRPGVSPCGRSSDRASWMVQKTFVHAPLPPVTPVPGLVARARARSLPRDFGSEARPPAAAAAGPGLAAPGLGSPAPPRPGQLRRHRTADSAALPPSPGLSGSPQFVPPSPCLSLRMPQTPQTPLYAGSHYSQKAAARSAAAPMDAGVVLRLADYL